MRRSWLSRSIATCTAVVEANRSRARAVASGFPTSTKMTCLPESSSVSGPNMGCTEVTLAPAWARAAKPVRKGLLSEPTSRTRPLGGLSAISRRISFVTRRGEARTITS